MGQSGCPQDAPVGSYTETQNYKYCFLNDKNGVGISDSSGVLDTIIEESDDMIDSEVEVDVELEDLSVSATASESEIQSDHGGRGYKLNLCSHSVCWRQYRFEHSFYLWEHSLSFYGFD